MNKFKDGLSYEDVLMLPRYSEIRSRSHVDLSVELSKGIKLGNPFIPANMKTIINKEVIEVMTQNKSMTLMHRFDSIEEQYEVAKWIVDNGFENYCGMSIGVKDSDYKVADNFVALGIKIICIDVAHGHSIMTLEMCKYISEKHPNIFLIAGNVATGEAARDLWLAGADACKVGIGAGCFAGNTKILMSNGTYKNIKDVEIGDYVINKNGKSVKVINSFSTGVKKVVKIKNNSFYTESYATPDHKMWVGDLNSVSKTSLASSGYTHHLNKVSKTKQSKYKWKTLSELNQDVFLMPKNIEFSLSEKFSIELKKRCGGNARWNKDNVKYEIDSVINPSYESGYLFGTFLGDGDALSTSYNESHIGRVCWTFGKKEIDIANNLVKCIKKIFNKDAKIDNAHSNMLKVYFYYKPLADYLHSNFLKKENKKLPTELLVNNKEYLQGLFDGLIDSDGNIDNNRLCFTNTSSQLIELFGVLNYIIYGHFPISAKKQITTGSLTMNIENCNQPYVSRSLSNYKARLTNDYQIIKKMSIEDVEEEMEVFDLTVDCDTHSFIANNMIVHNSICLTRIETGNGSPQLTAVMDAYEEKEKLEKLTQFVDRKIYLIADGGLTNAGNCAKALAFADMIMAGNLFASTDESPGEILEVDGVRYKHYDGSSTYRTTNVEGVKALKECKGPLQSVLNHLTQGLSSALAYQGVDNLKDLQQVAEFIKVSPLAQRENGAHDVKVVG